MTNLFPSCLRERMEQTDSTKTCNSLLRASCLFIKIHLCVNVAALDICCNVKYGLTHLIRFRLSQNMDKKTHMCPLTSTFDATKLIVKRNVQPHSQ